MSPTASLPNFRERLASALLRLYPFKSGLGSVASSKPFAVLAGQRAANLWAKVAGGEALVPSLDLVGRAMFFGGDLDPKVSWAVNRFTKPGDVALDIGANLGLISWRLAKQVGAAGQVHSFEPNPAMQAYIEATLARNPALPVRLHRVALGAEAAVLSLTIPKENAGAASFVSVNGREVDHCVEVPVMTLDQFLADRGIDRVDFIKIDVEGFEAEVLRGGTGMLRNMRPRAIVFEENGAIDGAELPAAFRILQAAGYEIFGLPKRYFRVQMLPLEAVKAQGAHDFVALLRGN